MNTLFGLRALASQTFNFSIPEGTIEFKLDFKPAIQMFMLDVIFKGLTINGIRVCNSLNLLEQYTELIPFGVQISTSPLVGYEPSLIDDFSSERVRMNILDQEDIDLIEEVLTQYKEDEV